MEKTANDLRNHSIAETFKIINTIRITVHREKLPPNLVSYCNALEDIFKIHQKQNNNTNPKIVNDYLILPILELNKKEFDLTKEYIEILDPITLNSLLNESLVRYENQKNLIESNRKYFIHLNESFILNFNKLKFSYKTLF